MVRFASLKAAVRPLAALLCIGLATCTTEPGTRGTMTSRVDLTALRSLHGFPLLDQLLLELRRGDQSVAVSQLLNAAELNVGSEGISIRLDIPLAGPTEEFGLNLELRLLGITLYRATSTVTVVAGESVETAPIVPLYIGPGLGADSMTLVVAPPLILSGTIGVATAVVLDAGAVINGVPVTITTSDTTQLRATATALNIFTLSAAPNASGQFTVTASTPTGLTRSTTVAVLRPSDIIDSVFAVTSLLQNVLVNQLAGILPVIRVLDANHQPKSGVPVTFALGGAGGILQGASDTTDANGEASPLLWRIGQLVGVNTLTASVSGKPPVVFQATGLPTIPLNIVKLSGDLQIDSLLRTLLQPLVAEVRDSFGNVVPNAPFNWLASDGSLAPASGTANAQGRAQSNWTLGLLQVLPVATLTSGQASTAFSATTLLPIQVPPIRLSFPGIAGLPLGISTLVNVSLDQAPQAPVQIALTSSNSNLFTIALGNTITINPGQTSGTALLLGVSLGSGTLNATAPGYGRVSLPIVVRLLP
jgi:hypothetical protein